MSTSFRNKIDNNFILNLRPEAIFEIKRDIELYRQGYFFFYAVDTYDIINHFLPYTDTGLISSPNKNIAQQAVAYEVFFSSFINNKLIILDEYKRELLAAKSHIERQIRNSGILSANIEDVKDEIAAIRQGTTEDKENFRKNIELVLFLLILSENKNNIYKNYFEFIKSKLSIFKFNTSDEQRDSALEQVFDQCKPARETEKVYDLFVEKCLYYLSRLGSDLERYTYLENSYRDIEAIGRLNAINETIKTQFPDQKAYFIYLSSAPFKSREIISIFKSIPEQETQDNWFAGYNFHRNIFQCFLFKILLEEFPDKNDTRPLDILDSLANLNSHRGKLLVYGDKNMDTENTERNMQMLISILERYSSNIDNHFYFKVYNKYQALFDLSLPDADKEIANIIKDANQYLQKEQILTEGQDLSYNIFQYKQTSLLASILRSPVGSFAVKIQFGKDIVRDSYHHLPYLLFINESFSGELFRKIYILFDVISEIAYVQKSDLTEIKPYITSLVDEISKDSTNIVNAAARLLLSAYLYIIVDVKTPGSASNKLASGEESKEIEVIDILLKQKKKFELSAIRFMLNEQQMKMEPVKGTFILNPEFDYLLLWLLRRNEFFTEAIQFGNELVASSADPRFYHGLALSYVSLAYKQSMASSNNDNAITSNMELFDTALLWMKKANEAYLDMLQAIQMPEARRLIYKGKMAVLNSIADINLRQFSAVPTFSFLTEARAAIEEIKGISRKLGLNYDQLSIYNFTEAELLYFEALSCYHNKDLGNLPTILRLAYERYYIANSRDSAMHDRFKDIKEKINSLQIQTFAQ